APPPGTATDQLPSDWLVSLPTFLPSALTVTVTSGSGSPLGLCSVPFTDCSSSCVAAARGARLLPSDPTALAWATGAPSMMRATNINGSARHGDTGILAFLKLSA